MMSPPRTSWRLFVLPALLVVLLRGAGADADDASHDGASADKHDPDAESRVIDTGDDTTSNDLVGEPQSPGSADLTANGKIINWAKGSLRKSALSLRKSQQGHLHDSREKRKIDKEVLKKIMKALVTMGKHNRWGEALQILADVSPDALAWANLTDTPEESLEYNHLKNLAIASHQDNQEIFRDMQVGGPLHEQVFQVGQAIDNMNQKYEQLNANILGYQEVNKKNRENTGDYLYGTSLKMIGEALAKGREEGLRAVEDYRHQLHQQHKNFMDNYKKAHPDETTIDWEQKRKESMQNQLRGEQDALRVWAKRHGSLRGRNDT